MVRDLTPMLVTVAPARPGEGKQSPAEVNFHVKFTLNLSPIQSLLFKAEISIKRLFTFI